MPEPKPFTSHTLNFPDTGDLNNVMEETKKQGKQAVKKLVAFSIAVLAIGITALIGGLVMVAFESETEMEERAEQQEVNEQLRTELAACNLTQATKEQILGLLPSTEEDFRNWQYDNLVSSVFYSMTLITTIGYGSFYPKTAGGKTFSVVYGLIGIAVVATSLAKIGDAILSGLSHVLSAVLCHKDRTKEEFIRADQDNSGSLCENEVIELLHRLEDMGVVETGIYTPQQMFFAMDTDRSGTVGPQEFSSYLKFMNMNLDEAHMRKMEMMAVIAYVAIFTVSFAFIFSAVEGWSFGNSLYFVIISVSTIGLGDFSPKKENMVVWFFFICFGLGGFSTFLAVIGEWVQRRRMEMNNLPPMPGTNNAFMGLPMFMGRSKSGSTSDSERQSRNSRNSRNSRQSNSGYSDQPRENSHHGPPHQLEVDGGGGVDAEGERVYPTAPPPRPQVPRSPSHSSHPLFGNIQKHSQFGHHLRQQSQNNRQSRVHPEQQQQDTLTRVESISE